MSPTTYDAYLKIQGNTHFRFYVFIFIYSSNIAEEYTYVIGLFGFVKSFLFATQTFNIS